MKDYTLSDLVDFTKHEQEWIEESFPTSTTEQDENVSEETLSFILGFSKSLSVRDTQKYGKVKLILN
jgi:hypothetical protein